MILASYGEASKIMKVLGMHASLLVKFMNIPMTQKRSTQGITEEIFRNNEKMIKMLAQLSSSNGINQWHPCFYDGDPRVKHVVGVKPFTSLMGDQPKQGIDWPSVTLESPLLESTLMAQVETVAGRVEHTPMGPSIDKVPVGTEASKSMIEFPDGSHPQLTSEDVLHDGLSME